MIGDGDGFSFGAASWAGVGVIGGDCRFSFGAVSWAGVGVIGGGDGGLFFWTGIGAVGGSDDGFLVEAFPSAAGRAPVFWKYKLQVVDNSMR